MAEANIAVDGAPTVPSRSLSFVRGTSVESNNLAFSAAATSSRRAVPVPPQAETVIQASVGSSTASVDSIRDTIYNERKLRKDMVQCGDELRRWELNRAAVKQLNNIGAGNFGEVFRGAYDDPTGKTVPVAMKILKVFHV